MDNNFWNDERVKEFKPTTHHSKSHRSIGNVYGKLTILEVVGVKGHAVFVKCKCECGVIRNLSFTNLTTGKSKSCGCANFYGPSKKHGDSKSKLYAVFYGIIRRCYSPKHISYPYYGAIGITVCDEWRNNYPVFKKWALENGYKEGLQIDRFPNKTGNYTPDNCRFVTNLVNIYNRRNTLYIESGGLKKTVGELAIEFGLPRKTLYSRYFIHKWDLERALTTNKKKYSKK